MLNGLEEDPREETATYPAQGVRKLREADKLLAEGIAVREVAKALEVSEATYHRWRAQFGGMRAEDMKRLKELERENQTIKRIVANKELEAEGCGRSALAMKAPAKFAREWRRNNPRPTRPPAVSVE